MTITNGFAAVTVLGGVVALTGVGKQTVQAPKGQSLFVPHAAAPLKVAATSAAKWAVVVPAGADLAIR
jgi:mannose-6-phosphate isomerase class I